MADTVHKTSLAGDIDWELETSLPSPGQFSEVNGPLIKSVDMEVILTGASGHLGRHLLPLLVSDSKILKIHCVGVRDAGKITMGSSKVEVYPGDLTHPLLGLTVDTYASLASKADAIIHLAAQRSFWEPYPFLRNTNVQSIAEIIKLSSGRKVPIHFLSSGGVVTDLDSSPESSMFTPPANGSEGYLASKWAGEKMLERANAALQIPLHIYRPSAVIDATSSALPVALIDEFAHFCVAQKVLPDQSAPWSGSFDLIRVNEVVAGVCASVTAEIDSKGEIRPEYTHFTAVARIGSIEQLQTLLDRLNSQTQGTDSYELLPMPQWMGRLKRAGLGWMAASQDAMLNGIRSKR